VENWRRELKFDPLPPLLSSGKKALEYYARRDLLGEPSGPPRVLWNLPAAKRVLSGQQPDGGWKSRGVEKHPAINYRLIETWRRFRYLVEQYGFTREDPRAGLAAEFIFSCQTREGDIRGFLANQYATYYTGALMALLIRAGYGEDPRIEKGFRWLLEMRQDDGGWTIPILTHQLDGATKYRLTSEYARPLEPDRSQPFSHNWTGMVLRAFAAHPVYRKSEAARTAARLLKSRFFRPDCYSSYRAAGYWIRFDYPFWWNNLVAALDSLSLIGLPADDGRIREALEWLIGRQEADGLWRISYAQPGKAEKLSAAAREKKLWVSLAICRVLQRFLG
jgi:hypothetical protein